MLNSTFGNKCENILLLSFIKKF